MIAMETITTVAIVQLLNCLVRIRDVWAVTKATSNLALKLLDLLQRFLHLRIHIRVRNARRIWRAPFTDSGCAVNTDATGWGRHGC
jgi:hypothetical protein